MPAVVVDIECSSAVPCPNMLFENFNVKPPSGQSPSFVCINVVNEKGLSGTCHDSVVLRQ